MLGMNVMKELNNKDSINRGMVSCPTLLMSLTSPVSLWGLLVKKTRIERRAYPMKDEMKLQRGPNKNLEY